MSTTRPATPPPTHLSAGAQAYLLDPDVVEYPTSWTDAWSVQEFRELAHPMWCGLNELLDFQYTVGHDCVAGVPVERISVDAPCSEAVLLHFHGGMYCAGTPEIDRVLNAPIARATGLEVISPDYRLAPEHPFPAAVEDAVAVYRSQVELGHRVALYGESAGGGLAAACAIAIRDAGLPRPVALGLISPMLDLTAGSDTYRTLAASDPDYSDTSTLTEPAAAYAAGTPLDHPLVSPLFADLSGLPPTLIQVGSREVLLGDSTRFARAARAAGVTVALDVRDGGWHNFPIWYGVPEADDAVAAMAQFLTEATA